MKGSLDIWSEIFPNLQKRFIKYQNKDVLSLVGDLYILKCLEVGVKVVLIEKLWVGFGDHS